MAKEFFPFFLFFFAKTEKKASKFWWKYLRPTFCIVNNNIPNIYRKKKRKKERKKIGKMRNSCEETF